MHTPIKLAPEQYDMTHTGISTYIIHFTPTKHGYQWIW